MNLDRTFCASPNCKNDCGRKITQEQKEFLRKEREAGIHRLVLNAYFCGEL
jgi:hypothetical protein